MNRQQRRARIRHIERDLHTRFGCTCRPDISRAADWDATVNAVLPVGATFNTDHKAGCPFDDLAAAMWKAGIAPIAVGKGWKRCAR